jgi:hypothetical protein
VKICHQERSFAFFQRNFCHVQLLKNWPGPSNAFSK